MKFKNVKENQKIVVKKNAINRAFYGSSYNKEEGIIIETIPRKKKVLIQFNNGARIWYKSKWIKKLKS